MKKLSVFIVSAFCLFFAVPLFSATADGFAYEINGRNSIIITKYLGNDRDVIVPSELNGQLVTAIGECAFELNSSIESVVLPDSITVIEKYAFEKCEI